MDKSSFDDKKDFKLKSFDWGKVKKCFRYKSFFNKMVDFWSFTNTPKINQFIKETFLSETFFHFSSIKTF